MRRAWTVEERAELEFVRAWNRMADAADAEAKAAKPVRRIRRSR